MAIHEKSHDFFKNGGTKPIHPGEKLDCGEKFRIFFSKTVILKRPVRERNLIETQWR